MMQLIRILLVEDRADDQVLLENTLMSAGISYEIIRVENETDYRNALKNAPDIIISDFSLPQFDGFTALSILKSMELDIPFILVSGTIGEEVAVSAMKSGANDYIMKNNLNRLPAAVVREISDATIRRQFKEIEEHYQNLVELSPDAIYIHRDSNFIFLNQSACVLFGVKDANQLIGKSIFDFIHPDYHAVAQDRIFQAQINGRSCSLIEEKFVNVSGQEIFVEVQTVPCKYQGKSAVQVYARNITARKEAEQKIDSQNRKLKKFISQNKRLKYADLMKSKFLATMSHELRTPLNAIIGFSEVLKDGLVGELLPKQKEYCTDIHKSGLHLLALINDILDLSKVEAGKMELDLEPIDVNFLLEDALSIVKENAAINGVYLKLEINSLIGIAKYDARKLKQIIYNLLSNAMKFSPQGSTVTLSANIKNNTLEISVTDTGQGMSAEELKRLFRPFEQLHNPTNTKEKGTGLGLMIAKRLAELHSGDIHVESAVGKGTCFTVRLPYYEVGTQNEVIAEEVYKEVVLPKPMALVIEDDIKSAELISLQLKELGIEVIWKSSAEEALQAEYEDIPELIILDILLPKMTGLELLPLLKNHKYLANIPVIVVSVVARENKGLIVGAVDVLQKPIGRHELANIIRKYIRESSLKKNLNVLVADDDLKSIELIKHALAEMPCNITCANDGEEALLSVKKRRPDLIVLDLMMPKINGFKVIESLKRKNSTSNIPIIILSSKRLTAEEQQLLHRSAINVLQKSSFNAERFKQEIRRITLG
ncbi:MAG: response regulator [Proteobacteria bacterium]|nr:response regulator [Pseudomonadota bacterium]